MIYLRAALAALSATGWLAKLIMIAGLLASLGVAYGIWHHKVYQSGFDAALAKIARADERTIARATEARRAYKDCKARGGKWSQSTGGCS